MTVCTCGDEATKDNPAYHIVHEVEDYDGITEVSIVVCEKCLKEYKKWYKVISCEPMC